MGQESRTRLDNLLGLGSGQLRLSNTFQKTTFGWKVSTSDTASIYYLAPESDGVYYRYNPNTKKWNWGTWAIDTSASYVVLNLDAFQKASSLIKIIEVSANKVVEDEISDSNSDGNPDTTRVVFYGYDPTRLDKFPGTASTNTVTDADGNTYPTLTIGTQVWMAENLRTTKYNDGTAIPLVKDDTAWANIYNNNTKAPAMCWYNNDQATYTSNKYGVLYNWYAVSPTTNGGKNVCPTGWHVPSDAEWTTLTDFLGGASVAGGKMKTVSGWYINGNGTNESGFSCVPGGYRSASASGAFGQIGNVSYLYSSSESTSNYNAWGRNLNYGNSGVYRGDGFKENALSVRCLRD
jgi:uncharacterized protein (TIGR02145 family)